MSDKKKKSVLFDDIEWGNVSLPGFDADELWNPKLVANRLKNKDPEIRKKMAESNRGQKRTKEQKATMSKVQKQVCKGKDVSHLHTSEIRQKVADIQRGSTRPQTSKAIKALYDAGFQNPMKGKKNPNVSKALKGKPKSEEHKANMRKPKTKSPCKHCGLLCAPNVLSRFHNDNCKHKNL